MSFRVWFVLVFLLALDITAHGATKPRPTVPRSQSVNPVLNHVALIINGERTAVAAGAELGVFKGDHLFLIQANVDGDTVRPSSMPIDIEGFVAAPAPEPEVADRRDDRGVDIRIADLREGKSRVTVRYKGRRVGYFDLVVAQPRFDYAVVRVNDRSVTVRQGEKVELAPDDLVKIESVRSNIQDASKIEVRALDHGVMRFRYQGRTFGEIRLPVRTGAKKWQSRKQGH